MSLFVLPGLQEMWEDLVDDILLHLHRLLHLQKEVHREEWE